MNAAKVNDGLWKAARSLRRQLNKLVETERWVHHVADLNSGEVLVPAGPPGHAAVSRPGGTPQSLSSL